MSKLSRPLAPGGLSRAPRVPARLIQLGARKLESPLRAACGRADAARDERLEREPPLQERA